MPITRQISFPALRAFEAAARRLSFTDAADELNVSLAAVSRHIRRLEAHLGQPLFRRLHRQVELTKGGSRLAAELTSSFQRIHRAVQDARGGSSRRLRLTVAPAFASLWLIPRLGGFTAAHPQIDLELETSDQPRTLGRDSDIAIRWFPHSKMGRAKGQLLFAIEGIPVAKGSGPQPRLATSDHDVLEYTLLHDDDGSVWRKWFALAKLTGFNDLRHRFFSDTLPTLSAAEQGQGVAIGFEPFLGAQLRRGLLLRIGDTRVPCGAYFLLQARDRSTLPVRSAFTRWIEQQSAPLVRGGAD